MLRLFVPPKIGSLHDAEQHIYSIPAAGTMASRLWASLTNERRVNLRNRALQIWKEYLDNDGRLVPHPPIVIPEYRQMLSHPNGEMIVEEM